MKEDSIEEDIILLKDFIKGNFKRDKLENYKGSCKMGYFYYKDIQQAIERILSDYKRILEENKELDKKNTFLPIQYEEMFDTFNRIDKENEEDYKEKLEKENSIEEDMKTLEEIIKANEDCINAIYSQMKVKNDDNEDIQYFKKEIQSIRNIVNNYLKEKSRADKLEKENTEFEKLSKDCSYSVDIVRENTRLRRQIFDLELENEKLKGQYAEYVKLTCNEVAKNSELNSELNSAIKEKK